MARTTGSSLKAQRSSIEPPPRPTISTSTGYFSLKKAMAAAICAAASSPWTSTGRKTSCTAGQRRFETW